VEEEAVVAAAVAVAVAAAEDAGDNRTNPREKRQ